eukprot:Hpha_TRINITY_DN16012_c2_g1::TRINITY_DN16012_c2_g1_i12::g.120099::m.120099
MGCGSSSSAKRAERRERVKSYREAIIKQQKRHFKLMTRMEEDEKLTHTLEALVSLPYPTLVWSDDGTIIHANAAALDMLQHDEDSLRVGNHISKVLTSDPMEQTPYSSVHRTEVITATGATIPAELSVSVLNSDAGFLFLGTLEWWIHRAASDLPHRSPIPSPPLMTETLQDQIKNGASPVPPPTSLLPEAATKGSKTKRPAPKFADSPEVNHTPLVELHGEEPSPRVPRSPSLSSCSSFKSIGSGARMGSRNRKSVHFTQAQVSEDTVQLLDSLQHPAMLTTSTGQIVYWNTGCERTFGPPSEEVMGHDITWFIPAPYHYDHRHYISENLQSHKDSKDTAGSIRYSKITRKRLMRRVHDVVARKLDSVSQRRKKLLELEAEGNRTALASLEMTGGRAAYFPLRLMISELAFTHLDASYWMVVCAVPEGGDMTSRQDYLMMNITETPDHPHTLPTIRPSLSLPNMTTRSIMGKSVDGAFLPGGIGPKAPSLVMEDVCSGGDSQDGNGQGDDGEMREITSPMMITPAPSPKQEEEPTLAPMLPPSERTVTRSR